VIGFIEKHPSLLAGILQAQAPVFPCEEGGPAEPTVDAANVPTFGDLQVPDHARVKTGIPFRAGMRRDAFVLALASANVQRAGLLQRHGLWVQRRSRGRDCVRRWIRLRATASTCGVRGRLPGRIIGARRDGGLR